MSTQPKTCECGRPISPRSTTGKCHHCAMRERDDPREWCPPHLLETYAIIRGKDVPKAEAKAMVLEHHEVEMRRWRTQLPECMKEAPPPPSRPRRVEKKRDRERARLAPAYQIRQPGPIAAKIIDAVADAFMVSRDDLVSRSRYQELVRPRVVAIRLLRDVPGIHESPRFSLRQIGEIFGGRDHSTIGHSLNLFDALVAVDEEVAEVYERLSGDV